MRRLIIPLSVAALLACPAGASAAKKPVKLNFKVEGTQTTDWKYTKQHAPTCDWPEMGQGKQLIEFGFARRRLLAGLGPDGLRQAEFFVAEEGHRPVAYVFVTRGPRGVVLEECGDRDPNGARIGAILQVLAARTPADPAQHMTTWLPPDLRPPQISVTSESPSPEIMMIRPLLDVAPDLHPVVYWQTDTF